MSNRNIFLVGFLLLVGCRGDGPIYVVDEIDEKAIILKNWHVIGPFETEEDEIGLDIDYLDSFGKEDLITYKEFVKLDSLSFPSSVRIDVDVHVPPRHYLRVPLVTRAEA